MPRYRVVVSATSNGSANTDDTFVELLFAAASGGWIKRVRVSCVTAASDTITTIKMVLNSAAGATGTAGTAVRLNSTTRATADTPLIKNGTNAFSVGTTTSTFENVTINSRSYWEWIPTKPEEELFILGGAYFAVVLQDSGTSQVHKVTVEYED